MLSLSDVQIELSCARLTCRWLQLYSRSARADCTICNESLLSSSAAAYLSWETARLDSISLPSLVSYHSCWYNNAYCKRNTHNAYQRCITWKEASYYLSEEGIIRECPATSCALTSNQYWKHTKSQHEKRHVWSTLAERNSPGFSAGHFQSIDNWLEATRRDDSTFVADCHIFPKGRAVCPITNLAYQRQLSNLFVDKTSQTLW